MGGKQNWNCSRLAILCVLKKTLTVEKYSRDFEVENILKTDTVWMSFPVRAHRWESEIVSGACNSPAEQDQDRRSYWLDWFKGALFGFGLEFGWNVA
jgi:hypothetical protein